MVNDLCGLVYIPSYDLLITSLVLGCLIVARSSRSLNIVVDLSGVLLINICLCFESEVYFR